MTTARFAGWAAAIHDGTSHRQKDREKAAVFAALCAEADARRGATRTGLARRLRLRPTSVGQVVQELATVGLVEQRSPRRAGGSGRPRAPLAPRADRIVAVSLVAEARRLRASLVDLAERPLAEEEVELPADSSSEAIGRALASLVTGLAARSPAGSSLAGAGLSLVGTVDPRGPTWVSAARWPRLRELSLAPLARRLGAPVLARRSLDTALELSLADGPLPGGRAAAGSTSPRGVLLVHWGFGIGASAAHRGAILDSTVGRFGEVGHLPVSAGVLGRGWRAAAERRCPCGSRGCLETVAALWALAPRLCRRFGPLPEDERALAAALVDRDVCEAPEVRAATSAVGAALTVLHRILWPDLILLTGPLAEHPRTFDLLRRSFIAGLPAYAARAVVLEPLPGGLAACRVGSARPLLVEALRPLLRRTP